MNEQGILLICCLALPLLIIGVGMKFHRVYNRQTTPKSKRAAL